MRSEKLAKMRALQEKKLCDLNHFEKKKAAFLMKDRLFELSMFCKELGWHKSGLLACIASDELEKMLENGDVTQSRYDNTQ